MSETPVKPRSGSEDRVAMRGSNQSGLRAYNERMILTLLRNHGPTPKAEVARMTGLSAQSASVIMRGLEEDGLIERCTPVRGKVGQPSIPMRIAPDGALFFGLKVGRRSSELLLVDFLGHITGRVRLTHLFPEPDDTLSFVQDAVEQLTAQLGERQRERIAGLGVAIPSYLWEWSKILGLPADTMAVWRERDIRAEIEQLFDFPVYLENDMSCACGAELVFGGQDYPAEFLYFYVGYFVGGGLVLNNTLFVGPTGNAGALGPLPVPTGNEHVQQLVTQASLVGLERKIVDAGGDASSLWEHPSSWNVDGAILDPWLHRAAESLAYATVAACSVIDFKLVLIDGWLPEQIRRDLVDLTNQKLPGLDLAGIVRPELREGSVGPDARSLGAASLPLSRRFMASQAMASPGNGGAG